MKTKNKPFRLVVRKNYELSGFENIINTISNQKHENQLCYAYYLKNKEQIIKLLIFNQLNTGSNFIDAC